MAEAVPRYKKGLLYQVVARIAKREQRKGQKEEAITQELSQTSRSNVGYHQNPKNFKVTQVLLDVSFKRAIRLMAVLRFYLFHTQALKA